MSDISEHRASELRAIERQPFFSKDIRDLTPIERGFIATWNTIIDERAAMLPNHKPIPGQSQHHRGTLPRWGKIIKEIAV